jgi:MFS family permease
MVKDTLMLKVVTNCWALFLGMGLIMLGNGLQGSLLGLRASIEGFGLSVTGLVMSGYFIGMVIGSIFVPKLVSRVGHVRTFGALASLASTSILVHIVFLDPWVWWGMRVTTGFAYAGLYIVAESWLNDVAENETRGELLSFYMLISLGGMAGGQFLLNIASPEGFALFIFISVLVSIAVIPILLSVSTAPAFETTESVGIMQLYQVSPLGVFGIFASGIAMGSLFGIGAVYAASAGLSVQEISFFMGSLVVGGVVLQYPLGRLSDIFGRRKIIIAACSLGAIVSIGSTMLPVKDWWFVYLQIGLVGGLCLPLYSLCIAHTNDYLNQSQMVAASGTLVLANGVGAAIGPPVTAFTMDLIGPQAFFQISGAALALVCVFAIWRSTQRQAMSREEQGDFVPMAPSPISAAFNPDLELEEIEAATEIDKETVAASFEELVEDLSTETETETEDTNSQP